MGQRHELTGDPGAIGPIVPGAAVADRAFGGPLAAVEAWIREVIAPVHPALHRPICPFITPALQQGTVFYVPVTGCRCPEDVVAAMTELIDRFVALPPRQAPHAELRTLVAVFVDVSDEDAGRVVIGAHRALKDRCTERGLMVGEFAPGYWLASTRDAAVNVGESPAPVLALRHMLPSDRRFLVDEDRWMAAWASRFGADRVPLFRPCSVDELAAIGRVAGERTMEPGQVLCHEGDVGETLFLILDGEATVRRGGRTVATLGPGSHFGELALLTRRRRNATVTATKDGTVLVLHRREFTSIIDSFPPLAHKLLVGLAERLSQADATSLDD